MTANINKAKRKKVYARDGYRCALCDSTSGLQIHHVVPRGQGGPRENCANMIALCWKCHAAAHGTIHPDYEGQVTQEDVEQACVEYLSELYACEYNAVWNPWEPDEHYDADTKPSYDYEADAKDDLKAMRLAGII